MSMSQSHGVMHTIVLQLVPFVISKNLQHLHGAYNFFDTLSVEYILKRARGTGWGCSLGASLISLLSLSPPRKSILKLCFWDSLRSSVRYRAHKREVEWDPSLEMAAKCYTSCFSGYNLTPWPGICICI